MRVLMLSWEYPPKIVGGIARHVEELSWALARRPGIEVHVVTSDFPGAASEEIQQGVHIHRVAAYEPPGGHADFVHYIHELNAALHDRADLLIRQWLAPAEEGETGDKEPGSAASGSAARQGTGDTVNAGAGHSALREARSLPEREAILLHAHDWLVHFAANRLKQTYHLPLVATIHATEYGRNGGNLSSQISQYINRIEWELTFEAWRVIVCTGFMQREIEHALQTPGDKIDIIYNGIHAEKFDFAFPASEATAFRSQFAAPNEKIVMFVGRPVPEKGASVLIDALPKIRAGYNDTKLIIAGGGNRQHLMAQADALGISPHVYFTGFLPDDTLLRLYKVADVAAFPSLYEPFGIVALEAMAAHTPVVVSDSGGLPEVVEHDVTGTVTYAGRSESLAWGILRALHMPQYARQMADRAYDRVVTTFNWHSIAIKTQATYQRVWREYQATNWPLVQNGEAGDKRQETDAPNTNTDAASLSLGSHPSSLREAGNGAAARFADPSGVVRTVGGARIYPLPIAPEGHAT